MQNVAMGMELVGGRQKLRVALSLSVVFLLALWRCPLAIPVAVSLVALYDVSTVLNRGRGYALLTTQALVVLAGTAGMVHVLETRNGRWLFLGLAAVVSLTDVAAQVVGRRYGQPGTFMPRYSPNKSSAGVVGSWMVGLLLAAVGIVAAGWLEYPRELPGWYMLALLLAPIVSTFGDILESATKRAVGIKDFGAYLGTGTGALLDRVDSWVAAFAVTLIVSSVFSF